MGKILLFTDPHFVSSLMEEYRWAIFDKLKEIALKHKVKEILCLGDVVDRKDKHPSTLVNRLTRSFTCLRDETQTDIAVLAGNHDKPLNGPYFWEFLEEVGIDYITQPTWHDDTWLLPFTANPVKDWEKLLNSKSKALFMHQTVDGALVEGDRKITAPHPMPILPDIPIYSGDVHRPQKCNNITYVGACHPVRFGENWENRVLLLDSNDFKKYQEIVVPSIKRHVLNISSAKELKKLNYKEGDQLRIRFSLDGKNLSSWPEEQQKIRGWAVEKNCIIMSIEAVLVGNGVVAATEEESREIETMSPMEIVKKFCTDEKLAENVTQMGLDLIEESS